MCVLEPLLYKENVTFNTKSQILKTFRSKNILEDILAIICGIVGILIIQGFLYFKMWYSHKKMTEENFFDMFNRIHNPDYYGRQKTKKKKTEKKKETRRTYTTKRHPIFKVQS